MKTQKRLAADIMKCSPKKIKLDPERMEEIKEAITKYDIKKLIKQKAIIRIPDKGVSRVRAKKIQIQKRKGRKKGYGSRKGKKTARTPKKETWINKIRAQRNLLKKLKLTGKIAIKSYQDLYRKSKGGFFRSKRHIKLYTEEHKLIKK